MSTKTTVVLALTAGFVGGIASQRLFPPPVHAQDQAPVSQEIRAHRFVLVDEAGVNRGVFGFNKQGEPRINVMDPKGYVYGVQLNGFDRPKMLPDATCATCPRKGAKNDPAADSSAITH